MIQQDYILRIIREFMEALQLFVSRQKDIKKKEEKILELYTGPTRDLLLERAMQMFLFIDRHSRIFSIERQSKIRQIQEAMDKNVSESKTTN